MSLPSVAFDFQDEKEDDREKNSFSSKRNTKIIRPMSFSVNDKVEVFSEEDGFQGSWHSGTVVSVDRGDWQIRYYVKYDHILTDDCSDYLIGCLQVPEFAEVNEFATIDLCNNLGGIRPLQDLARPSIWNLFYGLCVDAYYNDGWWEGVIFDREDGSEKRNIFFPELGDEMMVHVDSIRITRDWNDVSNTWQNRGTWLFLELIEKYEEEHYIPVSIKQIWYDLRGKDSFKKLGKWTSNKNDLWKSLVLEVIGENLEVFMHHLLQEIGNPEYAKKQLEYAASSYDANSTNLLADSNWCCNEKVTPQMPRNLSSYSYYDYDAKYSSSLCRSSGWLPVGSDMIPGPEYCPDAITKYAQKGRSQASLLVDCRKHLAYLNWKIEYSRDSMIRFRYTSPEGKQYYSLREVCTVLSETYNRISLDDEDEEKSPFCCASNSPSKFGSLISPPYEVRIKPLYCPEAALDWYNYGHEECKDKRDNVQQKTMKVKKHLSALGWRFWYVNHKGRNALRYISPSGKCYSSLRAACRDSTRSLASGGGDSVSQNIHSKMRNIRKTNSLIQLKDNRKSSRPNHMLRSSKRVQQDVLPNMFHQKPQTILSWLIDNANLLPRSKISYCSSKGQQPIAEGRISGGGRGIRCSCCGKVYTICDFEYHVTGKYDGPPGNIFSNVFLEDGRSLLDCQMQLIQNDTNNFGIEPPESLQISGPHVENDHICSVCHYGGELILCDQCPSSFHKSCLGMLDVPDGDWFCPSCCCKICGQNKQKKYSDHSMDSDGVLYCTQCDRKYHVGCLGKKEEGSLEYFSKKDWFCSEKCEEIFVGLQKLLGKPIQVGSNNISWTLLKPVQLDHHSHDVSDIQAFYGNHSQLNVALEVMHECFEPVEEPHTRRDLLKDIIFSERSELQRLNFRGFYTVVLRKGDEYITVATVRVYGEKVAEIPLVGTRFQYRKLGMCRTLMNMLEKKLGELGVQRLILPAVPSVLATWTGSFGFSKLSDSERLQLLDFTFLDFQDTVMCQKLLTKLPSAESSPSREIRLNLDNNASGNDDNKDGSSTVSEVFQAAQIGSEIVELGKLEVSAMESACGNETPVDQTVMANPGTDKELQQHPDNMGMESSLVEESSSRKEGKAEVSNDSKSLDMKGSYDNSGEMKCYKRRKLTLACGN